MEIKTILFDMDETLYPLTNGGFLFSSLYKEMRERSIMFLSSKTGMNSEESEQTYQKILKNYNCQLSFGFEKEFNIARKEYFSYSWDKDPSKHLLNDGSTKEVFKILKKSFELIIVSDGPLIWIENVLEFLEIKEFVSKIFDGESNVRKISGNQFTHLIDEHGIIPENTLMVGDSEKEDILPAKELGLSTVYVGKESSPVADHSIKSIVELM